MEIKLPSLIELGFKQGAVLSLNSDGLEKEPNFLDLLNLIKEGRFGSNKSKGLDPKNHLFILLSQDCAICNPNNKYVELAQIKKITAKSAEKSVGILKGKDYNKLYLKIENDYYEVEETLLTKIPAATFSASILSKYLTTKNQLTDINKRIVLDWRILHYLREPFPDGFNKRLNGYLFDKGAWLRDPHKISIHTISYQPV